MPGVKNDPREDRLNQLEDLGIEEKALLLDKTTNEVTVAGNDQAMKDFYARAFQEWAMGNLEGTAFEIFEDVTAILVARFSQIEGYKCLSLTRALDVVKCQLALA